MAVTRDVLETVMIVVGGAQYAADMAGAAASTGFLAAADAALNAGLEVTLGLMSLLDPLLIAVTAGIAALVGGVALLTKGLADFSEEAKKLFTTGVVLKNIGSSLTLPQVRAIAQQESVTTGISRPELEGVAGLIARTGVSGSQITSLLKSIADYARGADKDITAVGLAVEKGILGKTRGLAEFGIVLQDTGSKAANLALIQQQLNFRFEGAAAAFRGTLPGAIDAFQSSLQRFFSSVGETFAPAVIKVLDFLSGFIDLLTAEVTALSYALHKVAPFFFAEVGSSDQNPMAKVGHGGDPARDTQNLSEIADNTSRMADSVEQQVLGGSGEVVRQSFGFLQARLALQI